ncbi:Ribosomal protein L34 [Giardia duodenalis]|uniref:Ribosomal protein L34 n=2 Tax=Giardia intestinalis TaxID=5741 RepID=A8BMF7_GIAIC|nr:Ribosomal protein L34 [Giardia intestinalis]7PWG_g Chain g, Ribosomal protein L34 [Giardia lamblia ATCC 50803]7PWO_g2 Chain g2, Ribosomal protein L34 [Giardia lamblia ATCC 50803]8BR8_Lh Chain Lh, Ribosomal protein L34 [Giardia lamblia ATCC 50803]8BRM_Lh Chain Lh, Ribosomal protein L34 [Giardia lamblia ATCC 50803]8BSI_Lh Chain Lh, Ribosomal protein L34 [Giardia intestinalis]8BSJ_Lh Chain Lh, Ribosomal protein L34 [Giardia intestinalis]8BTD_Lh Chain Lh, Ribosomal protein L34 [Giardia lambli|eukprot:XP_001706089.1 Ribosomal protein L34 [Giardia lamblia ATCC 50803]
MADCRVTCRFHSTYRTRSKIVRYKRTPGNRLTSLRVKKLPNAPHCAETGKQIHGIPRVIPQHLTRQQRKVSRPYGGKLCGSALRAHILESFLNEENQALREIAAQTAKTAKQTAGKGHAK